MKNSILFILLVGTIFITNQANAQCFGSDFDSAVAPIEFLCSGETPSDFPQLGIDFNLTGDTNTQVGGLVWYTGINPDVDPPFTPPSITQFGCEPGPVTTVYAYIQCDNGTNQSWVQVANHSFQAFPQVMAPTSNMMTEADGTCTYTIIPACPGDLLSMNAFSTDPGEFSGIVSVEVVSGLVGSTCPPVQFDIDYMECPLADCFGSDFGGPEIEDLCSGALPNLPELGVDFNLTENIATQSGSIQWFTGPDPETDPIYLPEPTIVTGCDPSAITNLYAYVQCDDGSGLTWIQVASHSFQIYPEAQAPTLTGPEINGGGNCAYTLTPACPSDDLTINGFTSDEAINVIGVYVSVSQNNGCNNVNEFIPFEACNADGCGNIMDLVYTQNACSNSVASDTIQQWQILGCELQEVILYNPVWEPTYAYDTLASCVFDGIDTLFVGMNAIGCDSFLVTTYELIFDTQLIITTTDVCDLVLPNDTIILSGQGGECDTIEIITYNTVFSSYIYDTLSSCILQGSDTLVTGNSTGCNSFHITTYIPSGPLEIITSVDTCGVLLPNDTLFISGNEFACDSILITEYITEPLMLTNTIDVCDVVLPNDTILLAGNGIVCDTQMVFQYNSLEPTIWYEDLDGDGFGNSSVDSMACEQPEGYVSIAGVAPLIQANPDVVQTAVNNPILIPVLDNDIGENILVTNIGTPSHGVIDSDISNGFLYTPNPNFTGMEYFFYTICDDLGQCDSSIVSIDIFASANVPPQSDNDCYELESGCAPFDVLSNDADPENSALLLISVSVPEMGGTAFINTGTGIIEYCAPDGFVGIDVFTYTACDGFLPGGLCTKGTVVVKVGGAEAPNHKPVAEDLCVLVSNAEATIINLGSFANDADADDNLTYQLSSIPINGDILLNNFQTGSFIYSPTETNLVGNEFFTYVVCDNGLPSLCDTAYVKMILVDTITTEPGDCVPTTSFNTLVSCELTGTTIIDTLTNAAGCDSVATITYISESITDSITIDICDYILNTTTFIYTSQSGCDSLVVTTYNTLGETIWYQDLDGDGWGDVSMDSLSCLQPEGYVAFDAATGLQNANGLTVLECYPNPNNGIFSIQLSHIERESIQVYNQLGKSINFDVEAAGNTTQFEILNSNAGVYFVNFLTSNGEQYFVKVLVTR